MKISGFTIAAFVFRIEPLASSATFCRQQHHWKKARAKKQPYKFKWNEMDKEVRDSYYFNWPVYFPQFFSTHQHSSSDLDISHK